MNSNLPGGEAASVFFGSVCPSPAAIVDIAFTKSAPRTLIGLTFEAAEFERLDRLSSFDHSGNCRWDFEGAPTTPDQKQRLELDRKHDTGWRTCLAANPANSTGR
jgi:hypothetical protein